MPITTDEHGTITITGEDGLGFFQLLQLRGRLSMELKTGLKFRGPNTVKFMMSQWPEAAKKRKWGTSRAGKQRALDWVTDVIDTIQAQRRNMTLEEYRALPGYERASD